MTNTIQCYQGEKFSHSVGDNYDTKLATNDGGITVTGGIIASGITTTSGVLDINEGGQANTFKVEDLTANRVVTVGTGGELQDSANLTFDGTTLTGTFSGNLTGTASFAENSNTIDVKSEIKPEINIQALDGFFDFGYIPNNMSIYRDINQILFIIRLNLF